MPSTKPHIARLSFVFDFDRTLASESWDAACHVLGLSRSEWDDRFIEPLGKDWDPIQQKAQALMDAAESFGTKLDDAFLQAVCERIDPFPGVLDLPERLRRHVEAFDEDIACEFTILSSGFADLFDRTDVAQAFDAIRGGAFHFQDGLVRSVKHTITHAEKALHLRSIAEGIPVSQSNSPGSAESIVKEHDMHVPFDQMVYAGDGASDLQAFGYLASMGGLTIGIEDEGDFEAADEQTAGQRVETLAGPDYRDGTRLFTKLKNAATAGAARIAVRN
ncbi:HAD family hydrolase [Pararhizobium mangrovi]|uniref:Phosphoserine phosphatase n=1 Tax=Pararhizobium mangrovi TaxID=2590452 RepID=A0A506U0S9_9HYPH|nr:hypothetical protein [Pararhizobium mangrovi]TPW27963.1 hypothetical protein FJU11_10495 [Pararhizobium mangrovi]